VATEVDVDIFDLVAAKTTTAIM